jgi:hypothetical protein
MKYNKEITIYKIAEALKISPSTVSYGLKEHSLIIRQSSVIKKVES